MEAATEFSLRTDLADILGPFVKVVLVHSKYTDRLAVVTTLVDRLEDC